MNDELRLKCKRASINARNIERLNMHLRKFNNGEVTQLAKGTRFWREDDRIVGRRLVRGKPQTLDEPVESVTRIFTKYIWGYLHSRKAFAELMRDRIYSTEHYAVCLNRSDAPGKYDIVSRVSGRLVSYVVDGDLASFIERVDRFEASGRF